MADNSDKINELVYRLEILSKKQDAFSREISNLQLEIGILKSRKDETAEVAESAPILEVPIAVEMEIIQEKTVVVHDFIPPQTFAEPVRTEPKAKSDLEKFIGENLINKIGIVITVIGVAIGTKYSIEHDLISPLTRIILGYLMGIGLLAFAIKLKKNYDNFSAVLISGAMAILYFITYAAYSMYGLIPQLAAFFLMLVFTIFTVIAAVNYNRQVIAHIGLVGAYAVPFLLSEGSGKVAILFSYMSIINIGILALSFKKYWKSLYYVSFALSWFIFFSWYVSDYTAVTHFKIALLFLILFFAIFYATIMAYKLVKQEKFQPDDILLLLINSFVFFGLGYGILSEHSTGKQFLGLFALCNAIIHFAVSTIIYRKKLADKNLFYLVSGLVLIFITIAIPIQLDGNWVTLLWAGQATLIFWIGRRKSVPMYEKLSYALMFLATFSILHDWINVYGRYYGENPETRLIPLLNINFASSVLFIAAFGFINFVGRRYPASLTSRVKFSKIMSVVIPGILIFISYGALRMEITNYWEQLDVDSRLTIIKKGVENYIWNADLLRFKTVWVLNYSLVFVAALSFINFKKFRDERLGMINLTISVFTICVFLTQGLLELGGLRSNYILQADAAYFHIDSFNIIIRYVSYICVALVLYTCYLYTKQDFMKRNLRMYFDLLLHSCIIWIASSELITWMEMANSTQSYKFGLSILWGVYALLVIALGIWKNQKHLRIAAIALFAATLLKLFFYDIAHLETIAKTIVFVSLGLLLLIISFLYNKYKHLISDDKA